MSVPSNAAGTRSVRSRSSPRRAWLWSGSPTSGMLMTATWPFSATCRCGGPKSGSSATEASNCSIAAVTSAERDVAGDDHLGGVGGRGAGEAPLEREDAGLGEGVVGQRADAGGAGVEVEDREGGREQDEHAGGQRTPRDGVRRRRRPCVQNGLSAGWSRPTNGSRSALTRSPSSDSRAGSSVMAAAIVTRPTMIAPSARLRRIVSGTSSSPSRATTNELPVNRTALLLVPPVATIASILSRPACRSSR